MEVHTFDPELLNILMGKGAVTEGDSMTLAGGTRLTYERTFSRKVKAFPMILHFSVDVSSEEGACAVVDWAFGQAGKRNIEKIVVEYNDVRMDAEEMRRALCAH